MLTSLNKNTHSVCRKCFRHEAPTKELQTRFSRVLCLWSQNNPPHQVRRSGHLVSEHVSVTWMHNVPIHISVCVQAMLEYAIHTHRCAFVGSYRRLMTNHCVKYILQKNEKVSCSLMKCSLDGGVLIYIELPLLTRHSHVDPIELMQVAFCQITKTLSTISFFLVEEYAIITTPLLPTTPLLNMKWCLSNILVSLLLLSTTNLNKHWLLYIWHIISFQFSKYNQILCVHNLTLNYCLCTSVKTVYTAHSDKA